MYRQLEGKMSKPFKQTLSLFIRGWLGSILVALLISTSIKSAIADWYVVPTGSMKPTIIEGDRIFTNKLAYDLKIPYTKICIASWNEPKRGDIVVFNSPLDGTRLVKRIVGIPGDTVMMQNNRISINNKALTYAPFEEMVENPSFPENSGEKTYIEDLCGHKHKSMITPFLPSIRSFAPTAVPDGHFFMMGDNRDNSADSRYFGFVDRREIQGRATAIVISLDFQHYYQPRWPRFFTQLL
jgi:signal peptidase I